MVALAPGSYHFSAPLPGELTFAGACAAATEIAAPEPAPQPSPLLIDQVASFRDLTLRGTPLRAEGSGASLHLQNVVISSAQGTAVFISGGAQLNAERLVIQDPEGIGLRVEGATAIVDRLVVTGAVDTGVLSIRGGAIELERGFIGSSRGGAQAPGLGVHVVLASAQIRDSVIAGATGAGLEVAGAGAHLALERSVVRGVRRPPPPYPDGAVGVQAFEGARADLEQVFLEENYGLGVIASRRAALGARDLVVMGQEGAPGTVMGVGAGALDQSRLELERAVLAVNTTHGIMLLKSEAELTDVAVHATRAAGAGGFGYGLECYQSTMNATRLRVVDNTRIGVLAEQCTATVSDLEIGGTRRPEAPDGALTAPAGLYVTGGSDVELARAFVSDNELAGINVTLGGALRVEFHEFLYHGVHRHGVALLRAEPMPMNSASRNRPLGSPATGQRCRNRVWVG